MIRCHTIVYKNKSLLELEKIAKQFLVIRLCLIYQWGASLVVYYSRELVELHHGAHFRTLWYYFMPHAFAFGEILHQDINFKALRRNFYFRTFIIDATTKIDRVTNSVLKIQ